MFDCSMYSEISNMFFKKFFFRHYKFYNLIKNSFENFQYFNFDIYHLYKKIINEIIKNCN